MVSWELICANKMAAQVVCSGMLKRCLKVGARVNLKAKQDMTSQTKIHLDV